MARKGHVWRDKNCGGIAWQKSELTGTTLDGGITWQSLNGSLLDCIPLYAVRRITSYAVVLENPPAAPPSPLARRFHYVGYA